MLGVMRTRTSFLAVLAICVMACAPAPAPTHTSAAPASPLPATSPSAPPSAAIQPATTWVGEPITVAEAIDHRDSHLDDTELAVEGFSWRPAIVASCALQIRPLPAAARCGDNITWMSDADPGPQTGPGFQPPAQPALQLLIRPDTYAQVPLPPQPGRVIVLGHFDDHRSGDCPPEDDCRHNFLVDAILDPDAPSLDRNAIDGRQIESGLRTMLTPQNAVQAATGLPPGADRIVVASPVSGKAIGGFEPRQPRSRRCRRQTPSG